MKIERLPLIKRLIIVFIIRAGIALSRLIPLFSRKTSWAGTLPILKGVTAEKKKPIKEDLSAIDSLIYEFNLCNNKRKDKASQIQKEKAANNAKKSQGRIIFWMGRSSI